MKYVHNILVSMLILSLLSICACSSEINTDPAYMRLSIKNAEELEQLIATNEQFDVIVTPNELSYLGEFIDVIFLTDIEGEGDYSQYMYRFKDATYFVSTLYVYHEDRKPVKIDRLDYDITQLSDLRTLPEPNDGAEYTELGMFRYTYTNGKLTSIKWEYNDIQYVLDANLYNYDVSKNRDSFIENLLSPDTVAEAQAMIEQG